MKRVKIQSVLKSRKEKNPLSDDDEKQQNNEDDDDYEQDVGKDENALINQNKDEDSNMIKETALLIAATLIYYIEFIIVPFAMIIVSLIIPFQKVGDKSILFLILVALWIIVSNLSILYMQYILLFSKIQDDNLKFMYSDSMFFYLNAVLVFAFIKAKQCKILTFGQIFSKLCSTNSFSTFQYLHDKESDKFAFLFDFPLQSGRSNNNSKSLRDCGVSNLSRRYKTFDFNKAERKVIQNDIFKLNEETKFEEYVFPQFQQYLILIAILMIKIYLTFKYLDFVGDAFSYRILLDVFVNIFLYFYTAFNLNRILGNYDLRKKFTALEALSDLVKFKDLNSKNMDELQNKIDFTCPISMETWDNYRKVILTTNNELMQTLEISYFCLFFYFVFVTLIVFSSFFELYWIFDKESILLNPIFVIQSSFDFVFLSFFLLFRFYYGTKYNDTFDDMLLNLRSLSDVVDDLITMYDYYFDCILKDGDKVVCETVDNIYGVVIKKIKLMSYEFMAYEEIILPNGVKQIEGEQLDGIKYYENQSMENLGKLRKKLLEQIRRSVKKILKSVENDQIEFKYLFLNLIDVNFQDTFTSLVIALVTTLPTIVPKFISFYSPPEPEKPQDPSKFF
ncbi:transmembrane protein, putative (macronuclear) [Tetrahymena thermophila SB210]|uniref:Transmembrane protein, putative n=1 Tax=Tetrahymena thermophila (strain SB210) TaxID=312017 RepID=I7MI10_TETTS|nr:transmembrane protein, putative [Tetrahymena thermophila SB210]EAS03803.1 transmembrane protein, putative [Tetrahymena thermophila SB210]|eukprot:XP_001024048.1 transmembrane protein, putative [Tetrahymena thermophila SB210]